MKKLFLFVYFALIFAGAKAQQWDWAIQENVRKFAIDSAGNVFTQTAFTIKRFNSNDIFHWQKQFSGDLLIRAMAADNSGNLYFAGVFTNFSLNANHFTSTGNKDIFLCKIDSAGALVWNKIIGGATYDNVTDLYLNKQKKIIICGDAGIGAIIGSSLFSETEMFTARFDLNGNMEMLIHHSGGSAWEVSADTSGNTYLLGRINIDDTLAFGNGVVLYGQPLNSFTATHFIAKFDSIGNILWANDMGDNYYEPLKHLGIDNNGNIYLTKWGRYSGFNLRKFDSLGNSMGYHNIGGLYGDCYSLCVDNDDFIWLTGYVWSHPINGHSFIWEFDPSNNYRGSIPATVSAIGNNIANDYNNNIYVSGSFNDTAAFGSTVLLASAGNYFLAKMHRNSNIITSVTKTNVLCNGQCTGAATATPSGGQSPYTYLWAPGGETTATITGICAGTYTYTVTDSVGSTVNSNVKITQPNPLLLSETHTNLCDDQCSGTVILTRSGGTPPYTFSDATSGLCAGTYTYIVTDANGCNAITTATITQATEIIVSVSAENTSTFINSTTNILTGTPAGGMFSGVGVYGTNFNPSIAGIGIWPVTYTYTDENGCTDSATINITVDMSTGIATSAGEGAALEIYPNPTSGIFSINSKNKTAGMKICVYDVLGKCVVDKVSKNDKEKIDLTNLPKGIYTLEIEADGENVMKKIVLQ